jgi:hypothetical protein
MWPYIFGGSAVLVLALIWLVHNVSNKQVSKWHKLMLIYFWFLSFFPLILIPTEVVLKIKEGGAALTSSVTRKELQIEQNQSMYEAVDVPEMEFTHEQKVSQLLPDSQSNINQMDFKIEQDHSQSIAVIPEEKEMDQSMNKTNSKIYGKEHKNERKLQGLSDHGTEIEEPPEGWQSPETNSNPKWKSSNFFNYIMTHQNDHFLYELWLAYYFCTFLNGWLLLPLVVYYFLSGEFYFKTKLLDSAKYNLKYYLVMAIIMVVILLILVFKQQNLKDVFRVSLSVYNSVLYAVFLVSMAHGVARLPAKYFHTKSVQQMYTHQVDTFLRKKRKYSEIVLSMNKFYFILQALDEVTIDKYDKEKRIMYEIFDQVKLVGLDHKERLKLKEDKHLKASNKNLKNLVSLHYQIIKLNYQLQLHRAYVFQNLQQLVRLNRLSNRLFNTDIHFRESEFKDLNVESLVKRGCMFRCIPSLEKPFYTKLRPCSRMSLCIFLGLSSLLVIVVETCGCFMEKQIVGIIKKIGNSPVGIIVIVFFIAYLAFSAYYFFFRFNVFGVVGIKRGKKSNVYSLFYSTSMFVYLTYPICINVFHLFIGEENTCFEQALGKQELASIGKVSLFTLAPFIIVCVVILTAFNVFGKILQKIGIGMENATDTQLSDEELEALQGKLNDEVIETLEDYNEYQHALYRLGRSQNVIDRFI